MIAKGRLVAQAPIAELRAGTGSRHTESRSAGTALTLEELFISLVGGDERAPVALDWI